MDEVAQQQEAARRFEAAIAALEPLLVQSDDGQFSFGEADLSSLEVDPDDLQSLVDSVADLNDALSSGELALGDINVVTPEVAHG
jgi:hypothetical protein